MVTDQLVTSCYYWPVPCPYRRLREVPMLLSAMLSLMTLAGATDGRGGDRPKVELWTNRGDATYTRGDAVHINVRSDQDGYVTILRVATDRRIRGLFPRDPWEDSFGPGGRRIEMVGKQGRVPFRR